MRYSTQPKYRKYVKGYGFFSFARKFGDKYGKRLMDTTTKTGMDVARTGSKQIVQKSCKFYSKNQKFQKVMTGNW